LPIILGPLPCALDAGGHDATRALGTAIAFEAKSQNGKAKGFWHIAALPRGVPRLMRRLKNF
jgi:hypothetical protein